MAVKSDIVLFNVNFVNLIKQLLILSPCENFLYAVVHWFSSS